MSVDQQFNRILEKMQTLARNYQRLQRDHERLQRELEQSRQDLESALEEKLLMSQQISLLKMATAELPEVEKREFEKQISQYIREIDRCITYLSK